MQRTARACMRTPALNYNVCQNHRQRRRCVVAASLVAASKKQLMQHIGRACALCCVCNSVITAFRPAKRNNRARNRCAPARINSYIVSARACVRLNGDIIHCTHARARPSNNNRYNYIRALDNYTILVFASSSSSRTRRRRRRWRALLIASD